MNFKEKAQALQPNIVEWRRDIHMHPEVSFKEFRTSQVIKDHLTKLGIFQTSGVGLLFVECLANNDKFLGMINRNIILGLCHYRSPLGS